MCWGHQIFQFLKTILPKSTVKSISKYVLTQLLNSSFFFSFLSFFFFFFFLFSFFFRFPHELKICRYRQELSLCGYTSTSESKVTFLQHMLCTHNLRGLNRWVGVLHFLRGVLHFFTWCFSIHKESLLLYPRISSGVLAVSDFGHSM